MPNLVNTLVCKEYEEAFREADGLLLLSFGGLSVEETSSLRGHLAAQGVKLRMVRNSLAQRVLKEQGRGLPDEAFDGNTAVAYGKTEQAIIAVKVLSTPAFRKAGKVKLKGGVLEGRVLDARDAAALADIPDRRTLHAQILGCINGPARGLVCVLNALPAGIVRVINAHAEAEQDPSGGAVTE